MQCILTTFHILSGQGTCIHVLKYFNKLILGEALNVDPRQFYCQLYTQLLQLDYGES